MLQKLSTALKTEQARPVPSSCEHRTVSKDGRIVCSKIVDGNVEVSPSICQTCPVKAVNCTNLNFSLRQTSPSSLIVRFNGRTEIWDDGPAEVLFEQAACSAKVLPISGPRSCVGCALRCPVDDAAAMPAPRQRRAAEPGKVVPFPGRRPVAAIG